MGAKVGGKKGGAMADINVTPLVDVCLVLLIIFMVVTPMLSSGVDVKLPKVKTAEEEKDMGQHLVVSVRGDGAIFVDRDQVALEAVAPEVERRRGDRPLLIKGDQTVTYKQVREVMDKIHERLAGTDTMLLAAEKLKE
jgi:biopolymer transport protein TolR